VPEGRRRRARTGPGSGDAKGRPFPDAPVSIQLVSTGNATGGDPGSDTGLPFRPATFGRPG